MKRELAVSFAAAVTCHALLLFALRLGTTAKPLALSDERSPVIVNLVQPSAETPSAPPEASATPEPSPDMTPPVPEPTPDLTPPTPEATPPPVESEPTPPPSQQAAMSTPAPLPPHHERPRSHATASTSARRSAAATQTSTISGATTTGGSASNSRPGYRYNPRPDYPAEARASHQEGLVMLGVQVNTEGHVSDVSLARSSGYPLLDKSAIEAVRRWTFEPAREGGFPVASRVDVPVRFTLKDAYR